mgnify:CR=1 FL=1
MTLKKWPIFFVLLALYSSSAFAEGLGYKTYRSLFATNNCDIQTCTPSYSPFKMDECIGFIDSELFGTTEPQVCYEKALEHARALGAYGLNSYVKWKLGNRFWGNSAYGGKVSSGSPDEYSAGDQIVNEIIFKAVKEE